MSPKASVETATLVWEGVQCQVRHEPDFRGHTGWSRISIKVTAPAGHPLPIAEDGQHFHQLDVDALQDAGGPVAFYLAWLNREAHRYRYTRALYAYQQANLFGDR